jgi:hypothetical protein
MNLNSLITDLQLAIFNDIKNNQMIFTLSIGCYSSVNARRAHRIPIPRVAVEAFRLGASPKARHASIIALIVIGLVRAGRWVSGSCSVPGPLEKHWAGE